MIILITGQPGNAKTLYAINMVRKEFTGRKIYHNGIPELTLDWEVVEKWNDAPDKSVVIIDEAQAQYPTRPHTKPVPEDVEAMSRHRHGGYDLIIITQHPMMIDVFIRRLVGRHYHLSRMMGMERSALHRWETAQDQPEDVKHKSTAEIFRYPKELYGVYKSAQEHTHKRSIPKKAFMYAAIFIMSPFLLYLVYAQLAGFGDVNQVNQGQQAKQVEVVKDDGVVQQLAGVMKKKELDWNTGYIPEIEGMPWTAPVYKKSIKVRSAPMPDACVSTAKRCVCYSKQGTRINIAKDLCTSIVKNGWFDFTKHEGRGLSGGKSAAPPLTPVYREKRAPRVTTAVWRNDFKIK